MYPDFIASEAVSIVLLLFLLYLVRRNRILSQRRTVYYCWAISFTILMLVTESAVYIAERGGPAFRLATMLTNTAGFALSPLVAVLLAAVYDEKLCEKKLVLLPLAVNAAASVLSPLTGWVFSVSAENIYARGPLFFLYIAAYLYGFGLLLAADARQARSYAQGERGFMGLLCLVFVAGTGVQVLWPAVHTTWQCVTVVLTLYYLLQRELQYQCDVLTGLLNRQAFTRWENFADRIKTVQLVMLDIDGFKQVNDTLGHQKGDEYLQRAAQAVELCFSSAGPCYRIGGDEFCVVAEDTDIARLEKCGRALDARIRTMQAEDPNMPGISWGCGMGRDAQEARRLADAELYAQKAKKHCCECVPDGTAAAQKKTD